VRGAVLITCEQIGDAITEFYLCLGSSISPVMTGKRCGRIAANLQEHGAIVDFTAVAAEQDVGRILIDGNNLKNAITVAY